MNPHPQARHAPRDARKTILVTGASSGFGALSARRLAAAGHTVYASMRDIAGRNAKQAAAAALHASEHGVDLRTVELDVLSQASADAAVQHVLDQAGRLDVLVHNAGHMVFGPTEAFTPEQFVEQYEVNVVGTQRVNRAALPHLRAQRSGLLVWVGSSSTRGGTPPYLAPYFAAKAAMDSIAVSYATELSRWGIETTIVLPGAYTQGTNHFANAGKPGDAGRALEYDEGPYAGLPDQILARLKALEPDDADVADVAAAIARVVELPHGTRPFRVHVDPSEDGAEAVNAVGDRVRREFYRNLGLESLLRPAAPG
jgi:NAD(P)-dependent dehydrogenase (short-subunit alcohol dehydrogenase family)